MIAKIPAMGRGGRGGGGEFDGIYIVLQPNIVCQAVVKCHFLYTKIILLKLIFFSFKVRKKSTMSTSSSKSGKGKNPNVNWKNFLLKAALSEEEPEGEEKEREKDPDWEPPENYEDSDDADSEISEDEINDLIESMKTGMLRYFDFSIFSLDLDNFDIKVPSKPK